MHEYSIVQALYDTVAAGVDPGLLDTTWRTFRVHKVKWLRDQETLVTPVHDVEAAGRVHV